MASNQDNEKVAVAHREESGVLQDNPEKAIPTYDKIDYSGAHEKTDPKEIALVRKLDRWMMVSLSSPRHVL